MNFYCLELFNEGSNSEYFQYDFLHPIVSSNPKYKSILLKYRSLADGAVSLFYKQLSATYSNNLIERTKSGSYQNNPSYATFNLH